MENMIELGSIVKPRYSDMELMIIGYYPINEENGITYDYLCVSHVVGMLDSDSLIAINEEAIEKVVFHGYRNEDADKFIAELSKFNK